MHARKREVLQFCNNANYVKMRKRGEKCLDIVKVSLFHFSKKKRGSVTPIKDKDAVAQRGAVYVLDTMQPSLSLEPYIIDTHRDSPSSFCCTSTITTLLFLQS